MGPPQVPRADAHSPHRDVRETRQLRGGRARGRSAARRAGRLVRARQRRARRSGDRRSRAASGGLPRRQRQDCPGGQGARSPREGVRRPVLQLRRDSRLRYRHVIGISARGFELSAGWCGARAISCSEAENLEIARAVVKARSTLRIVAGITR